MAFAAADVFEDADIDAVVELVKPLRLIPLDAPLVIFKPKGFVGTDVLPLTDFDCTSAIVTISDLIEHVRGLDVANVNVLLRNKQYNQFPAIVQPRMQMNVLKPEHIHVLHG